MVIKDFEKLQFTFSEVLTNSAKVLRYFQQKFKTGLLPNIMYFDEKYPGAWEKTCSYDAIRYILWVSPYLFNNPLITSAVSCKLNVLIKGIFQPSNKL